MEKTKVIIETPDYQFIETVHTKKGTPLFVLRLINKIEDKFNLVRKRVDKIGGYYSGQQKGFVFYRELLQKEIDEIFKGLFFKEKIVDEKIQEKTDSWKYTLSELRNLPYTQKEDGYFVFKYYTDGNIKVYSIKPPSEEYEEALQMFAKQIIGNALIANKYNDAVRNGEMTSERAALIIKSMGISMMEIEDEYGELDENIRAVWNIKSSTKKEVYNKVKNPYLFERSEMQHLSDKRYSQIIFDALESGLYQKLIKEDDLSANKAAFIIESAMFEIPEDIINMAIYEKQKEVESLVGGYADSKTIFDISQKHGVSIEEIIKQFKKGVRVEREHTKGIKRIGEIVKDHLYESPYYYEALKKMEDVLKDVNAAKYKTHEEFMAEYDRINKERENMTPEQIAELKARSYIDKIKLAAKDLQEELPEDIGQFMKNRIVNWFVDIFDKAVVDYVPYAKTWLLLQQEFVPKDAANRMFFYGLLNQGFLKKNSIKEFIDNVVNSDLEDNGKPLKNLINLIPSTFEDDKPEDLNYEVNPKNENLSILLDSFVKFGKQMSGLMGVYFSKHGAFATNTYIDIFVKAKAGYLKKNELEDGIYGMSENAKDFFPMYGKKRYSMFKSERSVDFFNKYKALYSEDKIEKKSILDNDELVLFYKSITKIYNARAFKELFKREIIDRNPLHPTSGKVLKTKYPMFYIKSTDRVYLVSLRDMINAVRACLRMGFDVVQIGVSEKSVFISENIGELIRFNESGVRIATKSDSSVIPYGAIYYNIDKMEFETNRLGEKNDEKEDSVYVATTEDLKSRMNVLKKMVDKKKDDALQVRLNVVRKMIQKLSKKMEHGGQFLEKKSNHPLKRISINNYTWFLDEAKNIVHENEDGTGSSVNVNDFSKQEKEQILDQIKHDKPFVIHP